ncbi:beta-galactosidase [Candidatus Epulonipiscium viviparus]|uniref:beta-galactosidase n=1 Tax=Candidatus Epulonipiscium viviparus TaxID=420336 RepID=UPI00016BFE18|nr:beta-galactosidase [Candidatus Epulopiscium viviparus]
MRHIYIEDNTNEIQPLPFSGTSIYGETLGINSQCMTKDGKPWLPISGEFQYSRFSKTDWDKELRKIRACGVEIISSYVFWIHHEEEKDVYKFDDNCDIRKFAELCTRFGLKLILRMGPWITGECRNGGFPDWVLDLPDVHGKIHGDSPEFMKRVRLYFEEFYKQIKNEFWVDGGSIIGIQLDNEYSIHRAHNLENGVSYMKNLKQTLVNIGYKVPFYFYTAWNGALFHEQDALPVFGAYCDAPWSPLLVELDPLSRFLFADERNSDIYTTNTSETQAWLRSEYAKLIPTPYLTAELGGGMQPSLHRRILCEPDDTEALSVCMLGRGANMLGYYIFHGGTHPTGNLSFTNSVARKGVMSNTYPTKSYDFGAPIGEDNMLRHSYHALKKRHLMINELGEFLAMSVPTFPDDNATVNTDTESLRYCVRYDKTSGAGFLFINNHVRKRNMPMHIEEFTIHVAGKEIVIPPIRVMNHEMKIIPFNLPLGDARLISTNAQFLTKIGNRYFFYADDEPIYNMEGTAKITTLNSAEALYAWKFNNMLYISEDILYSRSNQLCIESKNPFGQYAYYNASGIRYLETYNVNGVENEYSVNFIEQQGDVKIYRLDLHKLNVSYVADILMTLKFIGDKIEVYDSKKLIGDYFTNGQDYSITLKRFNFPRELTVRVYKSAPRNTRYFDVPVAYGCELCQVQIENIYRVR